ncbi:hypothetical protein ALP91_200094 [Pseudomonas savastanoi pv. glycinea]|nr:hypothetical protein ALP91_200094 [Pseudomonas savastanoi pv. glycinea]
MRSAIAALAGVSASTVARYAHILSEVTKPATVSVLKVSADAMPTVTPGDQATPREAVQCLKKQALTDRDQGCHMLYIRYLRSRRGRKPECP